MNNCFEIRNRREKGWIDYGALENYLKYGLFSKNNFFLYNAAATKKTIVVGTVIQQRLILEF